MINVDYKVIQWYRRPPFPPKKKTAWKTILRVKYPKLCDHS